MKSRTMTEATKFSVVCSLFDWMQRSKSAAKKRSKFRKFLDNFCSASGGGYFPAVRLLLPSLDRDRGSYGLKESVLATSLVDALAISRDSADARRLLNWRKDSSVANAGNFALVAADVLRSRLGDASGGLTVGELNRLLDRLAAADNRAEKISVLEALIGKTNGLEMKWIIMIILKDLKLGISEKSIFHEFHPDAEDLFNVTCDLKLVCEKLKDRTQRHKRQDIEVGKAVRPQLAMRVADATSAWKKLHGKEVVVECKLDGDRIQIHKNGNEIHYFSRSFLDHSEYSHGMSDVIVQNVLADRCILDGEMLVWDTSLNRFAEFGSNQEIAKAARDGFDSDRQLCYVAFDILYVGDTSVIHRSLKERHELLRKFLKPLKGRLEILIPDGGLNAHRSPGEPCCSLIAHNVDDVEQFFKETIENRDEGIVIKDLGSKWEPSDRSGKWLKLKPDYVRAGSDLDVLIIGGYYGSGRRGGEVAQFLVGLAERPTQNTYPRRFISFCRVGTGLSDDELDSVVNKLKPFFRKNEYPKKAPPSFYQVTNNSKERPDVWIDSPEKSVILSITSDIRTIRSEVFAAPYSLRFPRIDRVRHDKAWHECLDVQSFIELVQTSNGTTHRGQDSSGGQKQKRTKSSSKEEKHNLSVVPSHLVRTDISGVKGDTLIFSDMMFYFVNVPPTHSLDSLHKLVVENGGAFSMNLNNSVTHCVAAESKGIKYQATRRYGDIIHYSWVLDCCSQKKLLPIQPKNFLFLSDSSKKKLQEEVDEFSDSYYWDLELDGFKQLLRTMDRTEDAKTIGHYMEKYCPSNWSCFAGCSIYLHASLQSLKPDLKALLGLTLRRLKVEVQMNGGKVSGSLSQATHLVILWVPGFTLDLEYVLESGFTTREKWLLLTRSLHVVQSQWLEDSTQMNQRLSEDTYSLKPMLEQLNIEYGDDMDLESSSPQVNEETQNLGVLANKDRNNAPEIPGSSAPKEVGPTRKRALPARKSTNVRKPAADRARRARARIGTKPAKISANHSDDSVSDKEENIFKEEEKRPEVTSCASKRKPESKGALKTRRAKIFDEDSDDNSSEQNRMTDQMEVDHERILNEETSKVSETERDGKNVRYWFSKNPETKTDEEKHISDSDNSKKATVEKLELMNDPVHAMLLDMIPRLGSEKVEGSSKSVEDEKPKLDVKPITEPKKKKVSYKDLASQLLGD